MCRGTSSAGTAGGRAPLAGEVFSCPVKDSVNGNIQFNTATIYSGTRFDNVRLEFNDGKVVRASANHTKRLNEILEISALTADMETDPLHHQTHFECGQDQINRLARITTELGR